MYLLASTEVDKSGIDDVNVDVDLRARYNKYEERVTVTTKNSASSATDIRHHYVAVFVFLPLLPPTYVGTSKRFSQHTSIHLSLPCSCHVGR